MKKILICTRKNKGPQEKELEQAATGLYIASAAAKGQEVKVVRDDQLPWKDLKAIHGSFNGAADAAGRRYDVVVLVEVDVAGERTIGKGQFRIGSAAREAGNVLAVARPGQTGEHKVAISAVKKLTVVDPDDWQAGFGRVEL